MTHIIVGTAGHIDHGKTALVRALTGIETDRLKEEKARGISIELGFAHLESDGVRIGFVDVPGHERFVKNMLAGATGIDLVLFVVAADESVKPQTREHFEICRLLGIRRGIIVLTKADLVDPDLAELSRLEVEELVAGSFLDGAPVHLVSAATGAGIGDLKSEILRIASETEARGTHQRFRLPVDRAFAMKGFGVVVTGTVSTGTVSLGDELEIYPTAQRVRVRGIQTHGVAATAAQAGQRTALNLAGIDLADIARGVTLGPAGVFRPTQRLVARVELINGAPDLKSRTPVHLHAGTAELEAEIRPLEDGRSPLALIVLRDPVLLLPGDRFIVRRFSPVETIGGGTVIDPEPPKRRRAAIADLARSIETAEPATRARLWIAASPDGMTAADLAARGGFTDHEIEAFALPSLGTRYFAPDAIAADRQAMERAVAAYHRANPLLPGIPKEELRNGRQPEVFDALLASAAQLASEGEFVRLKSHRTALREDEDLALKKIEESFRNGGLAVPSMAEVLAASGVEAQSARSLLQILIRQGVVVRVTADLIFHRDAIAQLRALLAERRGQRFGVRDFKEWTGVSRKFAIPLLEFLDRERVTRRDGDDRLVS